MRFLLGACERLTSVGVVSPGMFLILVIGLRDCVGGSLGRSDWQDRLSWWGWLVGRPMSVRGTRVISPGGVRIVYIRSGLTGSSSLDAVPVTGSLLFNAPIYYLAVCCAAELSSKVLVGVLSASGLRDGNYFSGKWVYLRLWRQIVLQRWEAGLASHLMLSWSFLGTIRRLWLTSIRISCWI